MNYIKFSSDATQVAGLAWGMHHQFREYIERMSDGTASVLDGAELLDTGEAFFPLDTQLTTADALCFNGTLQFTGHHGMLAVSIQTPRLQRTEDTTALTIDDPFDPNARMDLVTVELLDDGTGATRLTAAGTDIFMGNYLENMAFDPVRIVWVGKD